MPLFQRNRYYSGPVSSHFDGLRFFNPWDRRVHSIWNLVQWRITSKAKPWPKKVEIHLSEPPPAKVTGSQLRVCFVGHATVLIQIEGLNILTDPVWSNYLVKWANVKRVSEPAIPLEQLPKIDLILISHNHYDHFDLVTLQRLWQRDQPRILLPLGNDRIVASFDPSIKVEVLDWEESKQLNSETTVYLQPAQHWSARRLSDWDMALWGAFVIQTAHGPIYFAGDTGFGKGEIFQKVREEFGKFRFALLPIGAYEPRWFMKYSHMSPDDAVLAYQILGHPYAMPIHFGTFRLSDESYEDPFTDFAIACEAHQVNPENFRLLHIGDVWNVPELQ